MPAEEWDDLVAWVRREHSGQALAGRRLFSFGMPDVGGMVNSATQWVESSAASVANTVMSLGDVSKIFANSSKWVEQGLAVATSALTCMRDLAQRMFSIFTQFEPLRHIFASENGMMTLITQPNSTATLVHVVRELFNTSSVLQSLNSALNQVSGMFVEISDFFTNLLSKLGMKGRRLTSWTSLLEGINFKAIVKTLQGYLKPLASCTTTLLGVSDVLGPMMLKLDETLQGITGKGKGKSRRLSGINMDMLLNIKKNQEKYSGAISKIIPAWQSIEKLGVKMCPTVALSQSSAFSLKCRISNFVKQSTGMDVGAITGMVKSCGGQPKGQAAKTSSDAKCPNAAYSAGLKNLLGGTNSSMMGLVLAVVAGLGLLGGGGALAAKKMSGDGEEDSGEEGDEGSGEYGEGGGEEDSREPLRQSAE